MALSRINFKNQQSVKLNENSPIMQVLRQPQIMHVKYTGRSTFFKFKQYNERIQDEWRKANPHKITRPKAREQFLNTEMTKEEFLKQEREKAESKKKKQYILNSFTTFVNRKSLILDWGNV